MPFCVTYSSTGELSLGRSFNNPLLVAKEKKFTQIVKNKYYYATVLSERFIWMVTLLGLLQGFKS